VNEPNREPTNEPKREPTRAPVWYRRLKVWRVPPARRKAPPARYRPGAWDDGLLDAMQHEHEQEQQ
jgi:hypothetical protein